MLIDGEPVLLNDSYERRVKREHQLRASLHDAESIITSTSNTVEPEPEALGPSMSFRIPSVSSRLSSVSSRFSGVSTRISSVGSRISSFKFPRKSRTDGRDSEERKEKMQKFIKDAQNVGYKAVGIPTVVIFDIVGSILGS